MKKVLFFTACFAVASICAMSVNLLMSTDNQENGVLMENVEALASTEAGEETCYNTITTEDAQQVFYCGTCSWIKGAPSWVSGQGTCNPNK